MEMDSDFSHDPADLARLLEAVHGGADLALGSRYVEGGGVRNWGLLRRVVSEGGSTYARVVLGLQVKDLTGGFKCFRREVLETIYLGDVRSRGYAFQVELTFSAVQAGFRVVEVPIVFRDRELGTSKMSWRIAAEAMWLVPLCAFAERFSPTAAGCPRPKNWGWTLPHTPSPTGSDARAHAGRPGSGRRCAWSARWTAGSALAAAGLLVAVLAVASIDHGYQQIISLQPPFAVGGPRDVLQ